MGILAGSSGVSGAVESLWMAGISLVHLRAARTEL